MVNGESFLFCFPFNTSNILFHCLFAYIIYGQKYDKSFMIRNFFPLDNYHTCVFWASWICDMMSVINFEKFLAIIMSSISSSFYFSFQHSYYTIFNCLTVLECCIFFSFCILVWRCFCWHVLKLTVSFHVYGLSIDEPTKVILYFVTMFFDS